jgi:hypothetical protein
MRVGLNGLTTDFHKISTTHGYIELPAIKSPLSALKILFNFIGVKSSTELEVPIVN